MAARNFAPVRTYIRELVPVVGSFTGNNASNPTALKGVGYTAVTHTGTGTYQIILENKFADAVSVTDSIESSSTNDWTSTHSTTIVGNVITITITTLKAGVVTDMTTTERAHFVCWCRNSKAALTQG